MANNDILGQPPIYTNMTFNGRNTASWMKWFNSVKNTFNQFYKTVGADGNENSSSVLVLTKASTTDRTSWQNVEDGTLIYNTTLHKLEVYENGSWVAK